METDRFDFLCRRDGLTAAQVWEKRTAEIYRVAALQAADSDVKGGAKGMEWATRYCEAARKCDIYAEGKK